MPAIAPKDYAERLEKHASACLISVANRKPQPPFEDMARIANDLYAATRLDEAFGDEVAWLKRHNIRFRFSVAHGFVILNERDAVLFRLRFG
jgi:hypothetical protein